MADSIDENVASKTFLQNLCSSIFIERYFLLRLLKYLNYLVSLFDPKLRFLLPAFLFLNYKNRLKLKKQNINKKTGIKMVGVSEF